VIKLIKNPIENAENLQYKQKNVDFPIDVPRMD